MKHWNFSETWRRGDFHLSASRWRHVLHRTRTYSTLHKVSDRQTPVRYHYDKIIRISCIKDTQYWFLSFTKFFLEDFTRLINHDTCSPINSTTGYLSRPKIDKKSKDRSKICPRSRPARPFFDTNEDYVGIVKNKEYGWNKIQHSFHDPSSNFLILIDSSKMIPNSKKPIHDCPRSHFLEHEIQWCDYISRANGKNSTKGGTRGENSFGEVAHLWYTFWN